MRRRCARPGCGALAEVLLLYDYARRLAWMEPVDDDAVRTGWELCGRHAAAIAPPVGWYLRDCRPRTPRLWADPRSSELTEHHNRLRRVQPAPPDGASPRGDPLPFGTIAVDGATEPTPALPGDAADHDADPDVANRDATDGPPAWAPHFDPDDDLGGELAARTPLLSRAFGSRRAG